MEYEFSIINGVLCKRIAPGGVWCELNTAEMTRLVVLAHTEVERAEGLQSAAEARSEALSRTLLSHAHACEVMASNANPRISRRLKHLAGQMRTPWREPADGHGRQQARAPGRSWRVSDLSSLTR